MAADVILVSPAWPGNTGGQRIAVASLLLACRQTFGRIHVIGISENPFDPSSGWQDACFEWTHAGVVSQPTWLRFAKSLLGLAPAVTIRYQAAEQAVLKAVARIVKDCRARGQNVVLIVEDVPTACVLPKLRRAFPELKFAVRSENILTQAFERFASEGSLFQRLPWMLELRKIRRFEKSVCESADFFWAITHAEAAEYARRFGVHADGVIGICLDTERYRRVQPGEAKTVVHIGRADLRKGKGLRDFVSHVWPEVRARVPDARLVAAGAGTERFSDTRLGVLGLGFVANDVDVLAQGQIFVNPQRIGAGLQVKSAVAMLAGKALVSTRTGIEGIEGHNGEHFAVADSHEQMVEAIVSLMQDPLHAQKMGEKGRQLALDLYNQERFLNDSKPLLDALACESMGGGVGP